MFSHDTTKFEYMSLTFSKLFMLDEKMTNFGQLGWEAYSVMPTTDGIKVFFKRKINE